MEVSTHVSPSEECTGDRFKRPVPVIQVSEEECKGITVCKSSSRGSLFFERSRQCSLLVGRTALFYTYRTSIVSTIHKLPPRKHLCSCTSFLPTALGLYVFFPSCRLASHAPKKALDSFMQLYNDNGYNHSNGHGLSWVYLSEQVALCMFMITKQLQWFLLQWCCWLCHPTSGITVTALSPSPLSVSVCLCLSTALLL